MALLNILFVYSSSPKNNNFKIIEQISTYYMAISTHLKARFKTFIFKLSEWCRIVNVFFNILIPLFVFIMLNKLTCKVRVHIAVWSLSKCYMSVHFLWKLSSNQGKTNRFPAKFARKAPMKSAVLYQSFFSETGHENSREIRAKLAVFSANLSLKIRRNLTFFPRPTRSPEFNSRQCERLYFIAWAEFFNTHLAVFLG